MSNQTPIYKTTKSIFDYILMLVYSFIIAFAAYKYPLNPTVSIVIISFIILLTIMWVNEQVVVYEDYFEISRKRCFNLVGKTQRFYYSNIQEIEYDKGSWYFGYVGLPIIPSRYPASISILKKDKKKVLIEGLHIMRLELGKAIDLIVSKINK